MPTKKRDRKSGAIESKRIPIQREIEIRFPHFEGFVTEASSNLSMTGMFVQSDSPQEPGTEFSFKFRIEDWKLIQGTAEVVWKREQAEGADRPAGMGARFLELDAQSRRMVRWVVEKHIHEGGKPFELGPAPASPGPRPAPAASAEVAGAAAAPTAPEARTVGSRPGTAPTTSTAWRRAARRRRATRLTLAAAAVLLIAAGALALALSRRQTPAAARRPAAAAEAAAKPAGTAAETATAEAATAPSVSEEAQITALVRRWADAWSEQRVEDYLSCYASDFETPDRLRRSEWEAQRRERLQAPGFIRVAITALEVEPAADGRARATFFQNYRSDRFEDTVRKTLELVREEDGWRIREERITG